MDSAPVVEISPDDLTEGRIDILSVLVKAQLASSRSEARRSVEQGGITADGEKLTDVKHTFTEDELKAGILLKKGKKNFKKITMGGI